MDKGLKKSAFLLVFTVLLASAGAFAQETKNVVRLKADLRDAPKRIFHATIDMPAKPGPLTLVYPKWIQGEHAPTGPIVDLTGLKIRANGKEVRWRRDELDMYAVHLTVPDGADSLQISLDYLSPADSTEARERPSATSQIAVLNWYQVALYPQGAKTDDLTYEASLQLPAGWKYGTALRGAPGADGTITFAPVTFTKLIDSPVIAGANFRDVDLAPGQTPAHMLHIAAEGPGALRLTPAQVQHLRQLIAETGALFGARHYDHYDFLLALSDHLHVDGVEHHESSDNRTPEALFLDPDVMEMQMDLLPHEFTHSWNGKYRRPAGLVATDYQAPLKTDLLWVYEGLTQYYGVMLAARSGMWTPERLREYLASTAAYLDIRPGRSWRDLEDTAIASQLLYGSPTEGSSWRRGVDYYDESTLMWLEADSLIRTKSNGTKSLDDFAKKFHGGQSSGPKVVPYAIEDVVVALNEVAPYDWKSFFEQRLHSHGPGAPLGGLENTGWKLVFTEAPNEHDRSNENTNQEFGFIYSLGLDLHAPGGEQSDRILDVLPGSPAAKGGLAPGMRIVAVNGRRWSPELLREAIQAEKQANGPIEVLAENNDYFQIYKVDYHGGERYPHLEAIAGKKDMLSDIAKMKSAPVAVPTKY